MPQLRHVVAPLLGLVFAYGCSAGGEKEDLTTRLDPDTGVKDGGGLDAPSGFDVGDAEVSDPSFGEPRTCEQAAEWKSYVGCEFWPTVTPNPVWSIFDFAVIVANAGVDEANVTLTGPGGVNKSAKVPPGQLAKIYLPWVKELKGKDSGEPDSAAPNCTYVPEPAAQPSVLAKKSAFKLVSSRPVTVYQFNALEYAPKGGPVGKDWSTCPGNQYCSATLGPAGCFSYTNDASLLLPAHAMTGTYRVTGLPSFSAMGRPTSGSFVAVTATQDKTSVTIKIGKNGKILGGVGVPAADANGVSSAMLDAGDVVLFKAEPTSETDLTGALVQADKPVQVVSGVPCTFMPHDKAACDHVEESVFPAETLGKTYVVAPPTAPDGKLYGHVVRLVGNVDGTTLTYGGTTPPGAPNKLDAGEVVDLGVVTEPFVVTGSSELAVVTSMLAGNIVDPTTKEIDRRGDPSQSLVAAAEQFRRKYVFLAPDDYDVSYADVVAKKDVVVTVDGKGLEPATGKAIGATGWVVYRVTLGDGKNGAHTLSAPQPVGLQIMGYGKYTSYQYPGGLDLARIAPPPPR